MRRLLLTLLAALSTLLLLPTLYLWHRSHRTADTYAHTTAANHVHLISSHAGALHIAQVDRTNLALAATPSSQFAHTPLQPGASWHDPYANFTNRIEWSAAGFAFISGQAPATLQVPLNTSGFGFSGGYSGSMLNLTATPQGLAGGTITLGSPTNVTAGASGALTFTPAGPGSLNVTSNAGGGLVTLNSGSLTFTGLTIGTEHHQALVLPYWFLALCLTLAPALWLNGALRRRRLRHRRQTNLCQHCGYDLRASTDRCPECGTAIPGAVTSPA